MVKCYRRTVSLSDLWVSSHEELSDFYASSWQRGESPVPLLVLRLVLAVVAVGLLTWSVVEGLNPYWLIYLTNWGLLLVTMMLLSGALVSLMAVCKAPRDSDSSELPWYVSMYWFLFNTSIPVALLITALYWILLYDPEPDDYNSRMFWLDVATHGLNSCLALLELLMSRTPVRALHVYHSLGAGLWYTAFTGVYYAAGGTDGNGNPYIYEILDWRQGRRAGIIIAGSVAGLLILYAVLWGVALCRDKISTALLRTTSHDLPYAAPDQHMPTRIV